MRWLGKGLLDLVTGCVAGMQRKTPIFRLCHSRTHVRLVQYMQLPENGGWFW